MKKLKAIFSKRVLPSIVILALLIGGGVPFLSTTSPVAAEEPATFQLAPLNPDFFDALQQAPEAGYGYVPPTMDLSHLDEIPVQRDESIPTQPPAWEWWKAPENN